MRLDTILKIIDETFTAYEEGLKELRHKTLNSMRLKLSQKTRKGNGRESEAIHITGSQHHRE